MKIARFFALILTVVFAFSVLPVSAEPLETDIQKLPLVAEENTVPESVYYYSDNNQYSTQNLHPTQTVFSWVTGRKMAPALQLNGQKQYLRLRTSVLNKLQAFTFSTWINWGGNTTDSSAENQPLFSFYSNQYTYLSVSMDAADPLLGIDGPCIKWATPQSEPQILYKAVDNGNSFAFPRNEWHHLALTVSETTVSLYIDGALYSRTTIPAELIGMVSPKMLIGSGFGTEPTLYASLQDTALYTAALNDTQIAALANDIDPLGEIPTTTTQSLATRPPTTTVTAVHQDAPSPQIAGLPIGLVVTLGAFILLIVTLSITFSVRNSSVKTDGATSQNEEGSDV